MCFVLHMATHDNDNTDTFSALGFEAALILDRLRHLRMIAEHVGDAGKRAYEHDEQIDGNKSCGETAMTESEIQKRAV